MSAKTMVSVNIIHDLLHADDCNLVADTKDDIQCIMDAFNNACTGLGLTITVVMYHPTLGKPYIERNVFCME